MAFPTFDGHFWVVRDGKIIDPHFPEYDFVKTVQGCVGEKVYLPAPALVQKIFIKKFNDISTKMEFSDEVYEMVFRKVREGCCYQNARLEIAKRGGELVFGSMGWERRRGGIHYEFGGEGWSVAQHLKM